MMEKLLPNYVEIETSTYCNRSCSWCPNVKYERSKTQRLIEPELFDKTIEDLRNVNFSGKIALHNYNEPLLDPKLFRHVKSAKKILPESRILILTNGDFLNKKYAEILGDMGVSLLRVTIYDGINSKSPHKLVKRHMRNTGLGGELEDISDTFGKKYKTSYGGMDVVYYIPDSSMFTSRAGTVKRSGRGNVNECFLPLSSSAIDFEGNMKICCEVYPEDELHRKHGIIGNLAERGFGDLWFSDDYNVIRKDMIKHKNTNPVCLSCGKKPKSALVVEEEKLREWRKYMGI